MRRAEDLQKFDLKKMSTLITQTTLESHFHTIDFFKNTYGQLRIKFFDQFMIISSKMNIIAKAQ